MFGLSANDLELITDILKKYPLVKEAIIFGSRAKGNYHRGSDIDIALKGEVSDETARQIACRLNNETPLPYKFDVINYETISDLPLKAHINRRGITFYFSSYRTSRE